MVMVMVMVRVKVMVMVVVVVMEMGHRDRGSDGTQSKDVLNSVGFPIRQ